MRRTCLAAAFGLLALDPAAAQDKPAEIPFEGGKLTITETAEGEKIVAFDGRELARNYVAFHDRMVEVGNAKVALFSVGNGGNACGPGTLIVWKVGEDEVQGTLVGSDCGAPPPAATSDAIYFVPMPLPGTSEDVRVWTPEAGVRLAGRMSFAPQPGSGWNEIAAKKPDYMYEVFANAAVYEAAQDLLGGELEDMAASLLTSGRAEALSTGVVYGEGCVPHACGVRDGFMAVDPDEKKVYFAQQQEGAEPRTWPDIGEWPEDIRETMHKALVGG